MALSEGSSMTFSDNPELGSPIPIDHRERPSDRHTSVLPSSERGEDEAREHYERSLAEADVPDANLEASHDSTGEAGSHEVYAPAEARTPKQPTLADWDILTHPDETTPERSGKDHR